MKIEAKEFATAPAVLRLYLVGPLAVLICVILACAAEARAQVSFHDILLPGSEYRRGYEERYKAAEQALTAKSAVQWARSNAGSDDDNTEEKSEFTGAAEVESLASSSNEPFLATAISTNNSDRPGFQSRPATEVPAEEQTQTWNFHAQRKCCNFENAYGGRPERKWAARSQAARSNSWSMN